MSDQELSQDELEAVSSYMRDVAAASVRAVSPPPASLVWWKAELEARRGRQRRVVASLESMEAVQVFVAAVGADGACCLGLARLGLVTDQPDLGRCGAHGCHAGSRDATNDMGLVCSCALIPTKN